MDCLCEAAAVHFAPTLYLNESQSCLALNPHAHEWWRSYRYCEAIAKNHFSSIDAVGRLVHIYNDQMAHKVFNLFKNRHVHIGLRAKLNFNSTTLDDYVWWLSLENSNARKAANDLANVTDKLLMDSAYDCVSYLANSDNQWKNVPCGQRIQGACEIVSDECQVLNPCIAPKRCIPDSQGQVLCVCPEGADDDANCGVDCTGKSDGDYAVGACDKHYYTCSSQSATPQQCTGDEVFDPFHKSCASSALACKCFEGSDLNRYIISTESCMWTDFTAQAWRNGFKRCKSVADGLGIEGLTGRLAHVTSKEVSAAVMDLGQSSNLDIAMRTTPGHIYNSTKSLENYRWWLDMDNNNALLPVLSTDVVSSFVISASGENCVMHRGDSTNRWFDTPCAYTGSHTMCEIFYNQCTVSYPCTPPKVCVPDIKGQALCFCPNGAPNTPDCTDCTGKPDGPHHLGTCRRDYYSCNSGVATPEQCAVDSTFDPYYQNCNEISLECKCVELGGNYMLSTQTCIIMHAWTGVWYKKFELCASTMVGFFGMPNLYGRLAHVKSAEIATTVLDTSGALRVIIGMRATAESVGNTTELGDFRWWLDRDNPNAVDAVSEPDYITSVVLDGPNDDCVFYAANQDGKWYDDQCTDLSNIYLMCEIFHNECEVSDPCVLPKVCVPDVNGAARCFCPGGAVDTTDCTDCSDKADGDYPIAPCNSHYYSCISGVSATHQCPNGTAFDRSTGNCSTTSLECECEKFGGKYLPERMTCLWMQLTSKNWYQSFDYCKVKATELGVPSVVGRLAHVTSREIATAMVDMYKSASDYSQWIALRAVKNGSEMGGFQWSYDNENNNAAVSIDLPDYIKEISLDSSIHPCGFMYIHINKWYHRDCAARHYSSTACEFLQNECGISNPCPEPKVCLPDINKTTKCFCPPGAQNDDTCGEKCSGKPNGYYPIGTCVKDYYSCMNGVSSLHKCAHNETFDSFTKTCGNNSLECKCATDFDGIYIPSRKSCLTSQPYQVYSWRFAYKNCMETAQQSGLPNVIGRLPHMDDVDIVDALVNKFGGRNSIFGIRAVGSAEDVAQFKWWFDPDNQNAVLNISTTHHIPTVNLENNIHRKCSYINSDIVENGECDLTVCPAPQECYPDINGQHHCFCPAGSVNDADCGVDCNGKPDGDYQIGSCTHHYYSCVSGTPTMKECDVDHVFEAHLQACSMKNESLACKCKDVAGIFDAGSSSCLTAEVPVLATTWRQSYESCRAKATNFGIDGIVGRMAHLNTEELVEVAMDLANEHYQKLGLRGLVKGQTTSLADSKWWLDIYNSNAYVQVEDIDFVESIDMSNPDFDCAYYQTTYHNKWVNQGCSVQHGGMQDVCQFFYNHCDLFNPCTSPKVCVPDSHGNTHCFCPNGVIDDDACGMNCTGKADGNYSVGKCSSTYFSCTSGISIVETCPDAKVFDPLHRICADMALECKCIELGGIYVPSTHSCLKRDNYKHQNWYDWFKDCEDAPQSFGINGLIGRLPHIRDRQMSASMLEFPYGFIGARTKSTSNITNDVSSYYWLFDLHNTNAMLPVNDMSADPTKQCITYSSQNTLYNEKLYSYLCSHNANHYAICEILYDVCAIADPCPLERQCYPDGNFGYQCFCPAGAPNDPQCGVDCNNKPNGIYAIGDSYQHFYTCDNGVATIESCVDGENFDKNFKLCASDSLASKCVNMGGKFVHSSSSCILIGITHNWRLSFEHCGTLAQLQFGLGHRGRLVHLTTDDVASALGDLITSWTWTGLHSEFASRDIRDYSWWIYPDSSNNSIPVQYMTATNASNDTVMVASNLTRLTLVKKQNLVTNQHYDCVMYYFDLTIQDDNCGQGRPGACEIFYDPDFEQVNMCTNELPCQNNGTCIERTPFDGYYYCECTDEYTDTNCTDPNICLLESPCHNGENCTDGPGDEYTCDCAPEMLDKNCSVTDWCYFGPCANGGGCYIENDSFKCNCTSGWLLPNCSLAAPMCPSYPVSSLHCNGTSCFCVRDVSRNYTDRVEYRSIGRNVRSVEGITVQTHDKQTATHCAMMCSQAPECSFFSFRQATSHCLLHKNIAPGMSEAGYVMFAKIIDSM